MQNLIAYGRTSKKNMKRLETIQRKGVRMLCGLKSRDDVSHSMKKFKILSLSDHFKLLNASWGAKIIKGGAPNGVMKLFEILKSERCTTFKIPTFRLQFNKNLSPVNSISRECY